VDWQDRIIEKWQEKARRQVELAKEDVVKTLTTMWSSGQGSGGVFDSGKSLFGAYSDIHGRRRSDNGLQIGKVDIKYSGTLIKSLKEKSRVDNTARVSITIGFTGKPHRRSDQKSWHKREPSTQDELVKLLEEQFGQEILRLTEKDRSRIEKKYGVRITYD
jgi:hypothetical protein